MSALLQNILDTTGYLEDLKRENTDDARARVENIGELLSVAKEWENRQAEEGQREAVQEGQPLPVPPRNGEGEGQNGSYSLYAGEDNPPPSLPETERVKEKTVPTPLPLREGTGVGSSQNGLSAFLESVSLASDLDNLEDNQNSVTLMTLHAAKGLEFPTVFLVGMEEGIFPHFRSMNAPEEMEEERRLCYVGITRAKDSLYLTYAGSRMIFGNVQRNPVSRFVGEIPMSLFLAKTARRGTAQTYTPTLVDNKGRPQSVTAPDWDDMRQATARQESFAPPPTRQNAPARVSPSAKSPFAPGDKVKHDTFGNGFVITIDTGGTVKVQFMGTVGMKTLDLAFAKLEKA